MKNIVFSLILVVSIHTFAIGKALDIGGEVNSGYENLTCAQMIMANFRHQVQSKLTEIAIEADLLKCKDHFWKSDRQKCVEDVEKIEKKHRDMMNAFVNALGIRVQIYDSLNIADKSKLSPECRNITAKSYQRDPKMSDIEFFQKLYLQCKIKTNVEMDSRIKISDLYGNKQAYADREVCKQYMQEYSKKIYGDPFDRQKPADDKIKETEVARQQTVPCDKLTCYHLLKNPTNNPSRCYRDALLDCMGAGGFTGGSGRIGRPDTGR